jgi:hypothetical protein
MSTLREEWEALGRPRAWDSMPEGAGDGRSAAG